MIRSLATAMALALLASPVVAQEGTDSIASASSVNGSVRVNTGERFEPLQPGQVLKPGDRVMVMGNSSATLTFNDGCTLSVEPETVIVVPSQSTCAGGVVNAQGIAPARTVAVGNGTRYAGGVDWRGFWIVAGIVLIGDAILYYEDDGQVSP